MDDPNAPFRMTLSARWTALVSALVALAALLAWQQWFGFSVSLERGIAGDFPTAIIVALASLGIAYGAVGERRLLASLIAGVTCVVLEVAYGTFSTVMFGQQSGAGNQRLVLWYWIVAPIAAVISSGMMFVVLEVIRARRQAGRSTN